MRKRLLHLNPTLRASALVFVLCVAGGALLRGWSGALGAAAGVLLVVFSYTASSVVIAWTDLVARPMILPVGLMTYLLKFTAFGVLLYVVSESQWDGTPAMAVGIIVGTVTWVTTQAVWVYRSRIPYVDLTESQTGADS
jgi:hypothetical protein